MRKLVALVSVFLIAVVAIGPAWSAARPDKDYKDWFGHFAAGWSLTQGHVDEILDDDWYFNGGATYWPTHWPIGIDLDLSWSNYDVSHKAIDAINSQLLPGGEITGGDVDIWGLTVNGMWSPMKEGRTGFYIVAGVGGYYLDGRLTDTGIVYYPPYCDPWYWWCYPGGVGPGTYVAASDAETKFGWNGGVGLSFEVGSGGSQIYVEAKYNSVDTDRESTDFLPITLGYRW